MYAAWERGRKPARSLEHAWRAPRHILLTEVRPTATREETDLSARLLAARETPERKTRRDGRP